MSAAHKITMLALGMGLLLMGTAPETSSATMSRSATVTAKIAFVRPITANKESDISIGVVGVRPNDKVSLSADGSTHVAGKAVLTSTPGHPGVVNIGGTRNSMVNFTTASYTLGSGIGSLRTHCTIKGSENRDCGQQPIAGKEPQTLYISVDMTMGDMVSSQGQMTPSFDVAVVYQ